MRFLTPLFLALVLAVASVTTAMARVQETGLTDLVICAQGGVETVTLDASGTPVERPHHCPDCLAATPLLPETSGSVAPRLQPYVQAPSPPVTTPTAVPLAYLPPARGPPGLI